MYSYSVPFPFLEKTKDALKELYRVLKPGGLIGLRDDDQGSLIIAPSDPKMDRVIELLKKIMRFHGGDPTLGRRHKEILLEAGFTEVSASWEYDSCLESTKKRGYLAGELMHVFRDGELIRNVSHTITQLEICLRMCFHSNRGRSNITQHEKG